MQLSEDTQEQIRNHPDKLEYADDMFEAVAPIVVGQSIAQCRAASMCVANMRREHYATIAD
jgi:hypothetical protein